MSFVIFSLVTSFISVFIGIIFRLYEFKNKSLYLVRQAFIQIIFIIFTTYYFFKYFSDYSLQLSFLEIDGLVLFFLIFSAGFFTVKYFFEYFSGNTLYATKDELEDLAYDLGIIEKIERVETISSLDSKEDILKNIKDEINSIKDKNLKKQLLKKYEELKNSEKEYIFNMKMIEIYGIIDEFYKNNESKKGKKFTKTK